IDRMLGPASAVTDSPAPAAPSRPPSKRRSKPPPTLPKVAAAPAHTVPPEVEKPSVSGNPPLAKRAAPALTDLMLAARRAARGGGAGGGGAGREGRPADPRTPGGRAPPRRAIRGRSLRRGASRGHLLDAARSGFHLRRLVDQRTVARRGDPLVPGGRPGSRG